MIRNIQSDILVISASGFNNKKSYLFKTYAKID